MRERLQEHQWQSTVTSRGGQAAPAFEPSGDLPRHNDRSAGCAASNTPYFREPICDHFSDFCRDRGACHRRPDLRWRPCPNRRGGAGRLHGADRAPPAKLIASCTAVIDNPATSEADRLDAMITRAVALAWQRPDRQGAGRNRWRHRQGSRIVPAPSAPAAKSFARPARRSRRLRRSTKRSGSSPTTPTALKAAAIPSTMPANMTAPSRTITRRCG